VPSRRNPAFSDAGRHPASWKNSTKQKFNIVTVKTVNEKDYYTRIGVAFPLEKGGFNILFDALPTNGRALLLPDRLRSDKSNTEY